MKNFSQKNNSYKLISNKLTISSKQFKSRTDKLNLFINFIA